MLSLSLLMLALAAGGDRTDAPATAKEGIRLGPVPGPEDFEIQTSGPDSPRLLVASQNDAGNRETTEPGEIIALSLAKGDEGKPPRTLVRADPEHKNLCSSFHPHGVSLVTLPDGQLRLYVINHHDRRDLDCLRSPRVTPQAGRINSVEVYDVQPDGNLRFVDRHLDNLLTNPNDLAALPDSTLYVSNAPMHGLGFPYEALIAHSSSSVVMFDGKSWHRAAFKPRIANGIAVDASRHRLYVAETRRKRITIFALDGRGGPTAPNKVGEIPVRSGVDNLSWGPAGPEGRTLWVAAHPSLFAFVRLGQAWKKDWKTKKSRQSPSEVYRIDLSSNDSGTATRVFDDDGSRISAASVAFLFDGNLYVGQCFYDFVLRTPYHP